MTIIKPDLSRFELDVCSIFGSDFVAGTIDVLMPRSMGCTTLGNGQEGDDHSQPKPGRICTRRVLESIGHKSESLITI